MQERFGLGILALKIVEPTQTIEGGGSFWMKGSQPLLIDRQRLLQERFGLSISTLLYIKPSQVIEGGGSFWMERSEFLLANGQRLLQERLGLLIQPTVAKVNPCLVK